MMLFALLEGEISISCGQFRNIPVTKNLLFFLPQNISVKAVALTNCLLISCNIGSDMRMYDRMVTKLRHYLPKGFRYHYPILPTFPLLNDYFHLLIQGITGEMTTNAYQRLKREELFMYLLTFYPKEQMAQFFYPMLSIMPLFRNFIICNFRKYKTLQSFAKAANMSISTFNRKFKAEFGMTARQWINKHIADEILFRSDKHRNTYPRYCL